MLSFKNVSLAELPEVAKQIAQTLSDEEWFNLSLEGEMGAGKTTLSGHILHALGVSADQPVTSPTFTYLNEYETKAGKRLAHLDMYRAEVDMSLEDLGASDTRTFWGILVEWPARLIEPEPTHKLTIAFEKDPTRRSIKMWAQPI